MKNPTPEHYETMCEFILACSRLEVAANVALQKFIGTNRAVYGALIGQPQLAKLLEQFAALAKASNAPALYTKELKYLADETGRLSEFRGMFVHNPMQWSKNGFVFHNEAIAASREREKVFKPTLDQTRKLAQFADLLRARFLSLADLLHPEQLPLDRTRGIGRPSPGTPALPRTPGPSYQLSLVSRRKPPSASHRSKK